MNESLKPRFAVDLDEIERQLAQSETTPARQAYQEPRPDGRFDGGPASSRSDPLAELARIVGQDDPFQSVLASDRARHARPRPAAPGYEQPPAPATAAQYGHADEHGEPYDAAYEDLPYDPAEALPPPAALDEGPRRSPRRGLVVLGGVIGCAALGLGGAFALKGHGKLLGGGEPPLIAAANDPVKVAPQSPGGVEIPNQNKQIYERGQDGQTKVVNREEQPVDVRQAARAAAPETTGGLNLGEPRKVRTVSVRMGPDGAVIGPDATAPAAPAAQRTASLAAAPTLGAPTAKPATAQAPAAVTPAPTPRAAAAPTATTRSTAAPTTAVATPAAPTAAAPAAKPAAPAASAQQQPQRTAALAPAAGDTSGAATSAAVGGFSVQLGVSTSEGDAKAVLQRMQSKYTELDGRAPLIRKAEVNGSTVYRVRVGPMAKDEASSLCSKIQGQGGQCFVAKN